MYPTPEDVINALANHGLTAEHVEVNKNGTMYDGIAVDLGLNVRPTFYIQQFENQSAEEMADIITCNIHNGRLQVKSVNMQNQMMQYIEPEYVMKHIRIGLRQKDTFVNSGLVSRESPFDELREYLFIMVPSPFDNDVATISVTEDLHKLINIDETVLWVQAFDNTVASSQLRDIRDFLPPNVRHLVSPFSMGIITNNERTCGSGCIINRQLILAYANLIHATKIGCLPSSRHEWILIDMSGIDSEDEIDRMVKNVNSTMVSPNDKLCDKSYIFDVDDLNKISIHRGK